MTILSGRLAGLACALFALVLGFEQPAAAASASTFGPEVKLGEAKGGYVGSLDVMPLHGKAGEPFTLKAEKLPPNQEFEFVWRTVSGRWNVTETEYKGRQYTPATLLMGKAKSDGQGRLSATFTTPDDFGFDHDIMLQQGDRLMTQTSYSVDMTVDISPKSGPVGTPITVTVKGMGSRSLYNSWDLLYDNHFTGWISAVSTRGAATFTIPATGNVGDHVLQIMHGALTFPYQNPEQNPAPGRPRWDILFKVTPGAPVLPIAPEQQTQRTVRLGAPQGEVTSTPRFSGVGEPIKVSAQGLEPNKVYKLNWTRSVGSRVSGRGWEEMSAPIGEAKTDGAGRIEFSMKTPDELGGTHGLWIDTGNGTKKIGTHFIKPSALPLDVTKGPVGTKFTIHLKGWGWTETSNIIHVVYDNAYNGYACAFNSQGDMEIFVQATGAPGWHFIDLYPGIYKGAEPDPNLNNFRIPQLTYAADHPGEDLPAFHFAFEVTADGTVKQAQAR
ncbi:MAG TPA: hypothetical protein VNH44_09775 [Micropepsaceae bacterium]|nr:hypothetical protein [Micropepsaceae bacterium]